MLHLVGTALAAAAAASCARTPAAALPTHLRPFVFAPGWVSHEPLSKVLVGATRAPFTTLADAGDRETLARYLATIETFGPRSRPELFASREDVIAYLVDAHVAWTLALHDAGGLRPDDARDPRAVSFPLDGRQTTLRRLEDEILTFAVDEPRVVLCLNPGFAGGPPLPAAALEGYALAWQLEDQAARCGRSPGFWQLAAREHRVGVSALTGFMPGLPSDPAKRLQRLLDLVPPPPDLRRDIASTCGDALQGCSLFLVPLG